MNQNDVIFVFGSNLAGIHGAGAAKIALEQHGAVMLVGVGPVGMSYAIPTKDQIIQPMPLVNIERYVKQFIAYARMSWKHKIPMQFKITRIGCGLAGYRDSQIAPFFSDSPTNCWFDSAWRPYLGDVHKYWGTYP